MSVIEVEHMTVDYGKGKGVFDLTFSVNAGEAIGFLGPNGAGKTTTIRQLMGFAAPGKGACRIGGMDCKKQADKIQAHVGYLPGEIAFMNDMSGIQFIQFVAQMKNISNLNRAKELIEQFELDPSGRIRKMSKGMKQKIGIVCAFMQDADTMILDEPTSGLDPLMQNRFVELIHSEKKRGKTILMSSHMFEEVERTCDRAVIIKEGRLVVQEGIDALSHKRQKELVVTFANEHMAEEFAALQPHAERIGGKRVLVRLEGDMMPLLERMVRYKVTNLQPTQQNLESIFMQYYGGGKHA